MPERATPDFIAPLVSRFERRRPLRAGSLIVTLYGDAIAPRGGSLWLGSLNELAAPFGIGPGLVRTAMSRLVADGWFDRNRIGKNSYYRLSRRGAAEFASAAKRIYSAGVINWDGKLSLAVLSSPDTKVRQATRDALSRAGFGQLAAGVMVRPAREDTGSVSGFSSVIWLEAAPRNAKDMIELARSSWDVEAIGNAYASFADDVAPLVKSITKVEKLRGRDAFRLRILLIHEWRRIVLRDPQLPAMMLPPDWPGHAARDHVRKIYAACRNDCEAYLDSHAVNERGPLPSSGDEASQRFAT